MEYWAHEACFLPRSDFALVRHRMLAPDKMGWKYRQEWMAEHADEIEQLIAHIQENGRYAPRILNTREKAQADGGSGNRTNAILKGCLRRAK